MHQGTHGLGGIQILEIFFYDNERAFYQAHLVSAEKKKKKNMEIGGKRKHLTLNIPFVGSLPKSFLKRCKKSRGGEGEINFPFCRGGKAKRKKNEDAEWGEGFAI